MYAKNVRTKNLSYYACVLVVMFIFFLACTQAVKDRPSERVRPPVTPSIDTTNSSWKDNRPLEQFFEKGEFQEVDEEPVLIKQVEPKYPETTIQQNLEDTVVVAARIRVDGTVAECRILGSSNALFNDPAAEAVKQWVFKPALLNRKPVEMWYNLPVFFKLKK